MRRDGKNVFSNPSLITPQEFELEVKNWFETCSDSLKLSSFQVEHKEKINGVDGEFEIDVTVKFKIFDGAEILCLIECKKHKNSIKRDYVQVLKDRKNSIGAHKAFMVSVSDFQSGAISYAAKNGIALMKLESGSLMYVQANATKALTYDKEIKSMGVFFYGQNENNDMAYPMAFSVEKNFVFEEYITGQMDDW